MFMLQTILIATVAVIGVAQQGTSAGKPGRYASERSSHQFVGATRVVLENFDPLDKEGRSTSLQFDKNEVAFNRFGERRITMIFFKPIEVKLVPLDIPDPLGKERRIYSVELPKDFESSLGKNTLRLVAPVGESPQPTGARLLLLDQSGKVTDVLELLPRP
jgi:hypothetical protein